MDYILDQYQFDRLEHESRIREILTVSKLRDCCYRQLTLWFKIIMVHYRYGYFFIRWGKI